MLGDGGAAPEDRPWSEVYQEWVAMTHDAINGRGKFSNGPLDLRGHHVRDVRAKFMGIIINKFMVNKKDATFAQGVCCDLPAQPVQIWMSKQLKDVYKIASDYQDGGDVAGGYAVGQELYDKRLSGQKHQDYLLRILGRVPHFGALNALSHEQRLPASYVAAADSNNKNRSLYFRRIYDHVAYNILHLTYLDNPSLLNHQQPKDLTKNEPRLGGPPSGKFTLIKQDEMDNLRCDLAKEKHWPK